MDEEASRLTRMADDLIERLEAHPDASGNERAVLFLTEGDHGGIALSGYPNDGAAMGELLAHVSAVFTANGRHVMFVPIAGEG